MDSQPHRSSRTAKPPGLYDFGPQSQLATKRKRDPEDIGDGEKEELVKKSATQDGQKKQSSKKTDGATEAKGKEVRGGKPSSATEIEMKKNGNEKGTPSKAVAKKERAKVAKAEYFTYLIVHADPTIPASPINKDFIFFYSHGPKGGPFAFLSNFYLSGFRDPRVHNTHVFNCAEQHYQYCKLLCMKSVEPRDNDWPKAVSSIEAPHLMLILTKPAEQKALGRSFDKRAHDEPEWAAKWRVMWFGHVAEAIKSAVYLKFQQNDELRERLINTGHHELVEASPGDDNCGIGFYAHEARANINSWGMNLLGRTLMEARTYYQKKKSEGHEWKFDTSLDEQDRVTRKKQEDSMAKKAAGQGKERPSKVVPPKSGQSGKSNEWADAEDDHGPQYEEGSVMDQSWP